MKKTYESACLSAKFIGFVVIYKHKFFNLRGFTGGDDWLIIDSTNLSFKNDIFVRIIKSCIPSIIDFQQFINYNVNEKRNNR